LRRRLQLGLQRVPPDERNGNKNSQSAASPSLSGALSQLE
jgi:hypothetical protein